MTKQVKVVLALFAAGAEFSRQMFWGIQKFARAAGWHLQFAEFLLTDDGVYRLFRSPTGSDIARLLDFWKPDGCIVTPGRRPDAIPSIHFKKYPTVFIDRYPTGVRSDKVCVYADEDSIVKFAARELLMSGYEDFAYVPYTADTAWNRERGKAFSEVVRMNGKRFHMFKRPPHVEHVELLDVLSPWVRSLPKPCGVFAANDGIAEMVLLACSRNGISVPDEISVVGVDDAAYLCENTRPTISSVQRDFANAGKVAADALAELMDAKGGSVQPRTYKATGLVRRESSCIVKGRDRRVAKALEFIRVHACEGIGPRQVVGEMGISRTLADTSFRAAAGHTILDEIHYVRLERAKELLLRDMPPSIVADRCGYSSVVDLRRVFKARVGMTIGKYLASASSV